MLLQNTFQASVKAYIHSEESAKVVEEVRRNVELVRQLPDPLRSQIVAAYQNSFIAVYSLCALSALCIVAGLWHVRPGSLKSVGHDIEKTEYQKDVELESLCSIDGERSEMGKTAAEA